MYYLIFILVLFSSVGFFNYHGIFTDQMQRAVFYVVMCGALLYAVTERRRVLHDMDYPRYPYWMVVGSIILSVGMVNVYFGQSLGRSIVSVLPCLLSYLFYFVLLKSDLTEQQVMRVLMVACLMSVPVYFANLLSFPGRMFGVENPEGADFSRGVLRVYVEFIEVFVLILFYAVYQWKRSRRKIWIAWIILCIVMISLSVIRQIIVVSLALGLVYYMMGQSMRRKVVVVAVIAVVSVAVLPKITIFNTMIELSEAQAELNEDKENVRIRAWRYYTYENQEDMLTVLFGNGVPSMGVGEHGIRFQQDIDENKCYASDVGWAGFMFYFGLIGTLALLVFLCKSIYAAKRNGRDYLSYWMLFIIITSVASAPIMTYYQIIVVLSGVYLSYLPNEEDRSDNIELQQCL